MALLQPSVALTAWCNAEECDYIIEQATPRLKRSQVVAAAQSDKKNGTVEELSDIRTSAGMFFARGENDVVKCEH